MLTTHELKQTLRTYIQTANLTQAAKQLGYFGSSAVRYHILRAEDIAGGKLVERAPFDRLTPVLTGIGSQWLGVRYARSGLVSGGDIPYECQHPWPLDCFVQCGDSGVVFKRRRVVESFDDPLGTIAEIAEGDPANVYITAFFEAFPRSPDTFVRGEGKTIREAENAAWGKYQAVAGCEHPAFEKRGYKNGCGFCVNCGMFKVGVFDPDEICCECGARTYYVQDNTGAWWCEACFPEMPEQLQPKYVKIQRRWETEDHATAFVMAVKAAGME